MFSVIRTSTKLRIKNGTIREQLFHPSLKLTYFTYVNSITTLHLYNCNNIPISEHNNATLSSNSLRKSKIVGTIPIYRGKF